MSEGRQEAPASTSSATLPSRSACPCACRNPGDRFPTGSGETYAERRPGSAPTVDLDETPATAHDALNGGQTKAATRKLGGEKGIEDARLDAFFHAAPVVCDFQADKVAGLDVERRGVRARCFRRHLANAGGDLNAAIGMGRYGFAGIDYQIHENLLDLGRSGFDGQFLGRQIKPK